MKLLLDTHLILWLATEPHKLSIEAVSLIAASDNAVAYSVASLWEIAIKNARGRPDFVVDLRRLRESLSENGYGELAVAGDHALALAALPMLHKDPFDRILIAQAMWEDMTLLTSDNVLASYGGPVRKV